MGDIGNILITLCGFCTVCCGAFTLALFMLFRVTGRSLILPAVTALSQMVFNRDDGIDDDDELGAPVRTRARPSAADLTARVQSANQDFNQALNQNLGSNFDPSVPQAGYAPQSLADNTKPMPPTQSYSSDNPPPASSAGYGQFNPNRPSQAPSAQGAPPPASGGGAFDGLINPDNLFGDAGLPGLRKIDEDDDDFNRHDGSLRGSKRRRRGDDYSDDDVFGGLDEDGDGLPDFY